jgi:hypothetical protein
MLQSGVVPPAAAKSPSTALSLGYDGCAVGADRWVAARSCLAARFCVSGGGLGSVVSVSVVVFDLGGCQVVEGLVRAKGRWVLASFTWISSTISESCRGSSIPTPFNAVVDAREERGEQPQPGVAVGKSEEPQSLGGEQKCGHG